MNKELETKINQYREQGFAQVLLGLTDLDGVLRGKYVNLDKFASLMTKGGGFCDCVFGWDIDDQLYDAGSYTGWHTGFPDTHYRLLTSSERINPLTNTPFFLGEFTDPAASDHPLCPRTLLRKVTHQLQDLGFGVKAGFEYEFFVFNETSRSVREKAFRDLEPLTEGNFGYSVLRAASKSQDFNGLLDFCRDFDIPVEGLHCETGPGVWEAALSIAPVLDAADRATLFKTFSKVYFQQRANIATFMAKWSMKYPGQSGHFHYSLTNEDGSNAFSGALGEICEPARFALAGLEKYLPALLCLFAPTVNSYTRLVKGAWAPISSSWGIENRTCAIRWINSAGNEHIEHRVPGADSNPYLVAAGTLTACVLGLEEQVEPNDPVVGNAYDVDADSDCRFSNNLRDAADKLSSSQAVRRILGDEFVDHFVMTRHWEQEQAQKTINDWQLNRYFESI